MHLGPHPDDPAGRDELEAPVIAEATHPRPDLGVYPPPPLAASRTTCPREVSCCPPPRGVRTPRIGIDVSISKTCSYTRAGHELGLDGRRLRQVVVVNGAYSQQRVEEGGDDALNGIDEGFSRAPRR